MSEKRAILVLGPESSGNRMMTRQLVAMGAQGDGEHDQRWDHTPPTDETPIVWLYSVPHSGRWPDIFGRVQYLQGQGYDVHAVVMVRDMYPCQRSQVATGHTDTMREADEHIQRAYLHIFAHLGAAGVPFTVVSMAGLIARPETYLRRLSGRLGLSLAPEYEPVRDVDEKWWRGEA